MSLRAYQSNIYLPFLIRRLFSDPYRDGTAGTFILRAIEEYTTSAAHCLTTALFERAHALERSGITHGAVEYGKALRLLGWTIRDQPFGTDLRTLLQLFC
jgi:hypothetical protein